MDKILELKAPPATIRHNIDRLWGSILLASDKTGLMRQTFYTAIKRGVITDKIAGRMYRQGLKAQELVKRPGK